MKDYRAFKRYQMDEWESDKEWLGKRLAFLWDVRSYWPSQYRDLGLAEEKHDFYMINDLEVTRIAHDDHYSIDSSIYESKLYSERQIYEKYRELEGMKKHTKKEFLKKCNCNFHGWIECVYDVCELENYYG